MLRVPGGGRRRQCYAAKPLLDWVLPVRVADDEEVLFKEEWHYVWAAVPIADQEGEGLVLGEEGSVVVGAAGSRETMMSVVPTVVLPPPPEPSLGESSPPSVSLVAAQPARTRASAAAARTEECATR